MSIFLFMLTFIICVVGVTTLGSFVYGHVTTRAGRLAGEKRDAQKQLRIAEKGLRHIANGTSGTPYLDAQNTLEDINNYNSKEIN